DPDLPTPAHIVAEAQKQVANPKNHQYPSYTGMLAYRESVARWYDRRFGVKVDPKTEVLATIGSKEGIANFPLAYVNPGDVVLIPDPGYPVYHTSTLFCGGESYFLPLTKESKFLPVLADIPTDVARRAKILFINYPNNPTGATCEIAFFDEVIAFARAHDVIVCHDAAYTEMAFDGYRPPSFLQAKGAKDVGIEMHSLSKTYNMTGWRIGMAAGNAEFVGGLGKIKTNIDSGAFQAVQYAGMAALDGSQDCVTANCAVYGERRDVFCDGLEALGLRVHRPKATFYVWIETPKGYTAAELAKVFLEQAGIVMTPGTGFGHALRDGTHGGEGYVRAALTQPKERLLEAIERIRKLGVVK
ncbi:MAG: LL-diaminopimelate aminotransferase, partial [Myxococcales bacterium]|nr:LL-diaminopimelate aminotransferase [Myxococcales bacterium]